MSRLDTRCRSCGAAELELVLSLGKTPLANRLLSEGELERPEPTYPLDLAFCQACSLASSERRRGRPCGPAPLRELTVDSRPSTCAFYFWIWIPT